MVRELQPSRGTKCIDSARGISWTNSRKRIHYSTSRELWKWLQFVDVSSPSSRHYPRTSWRPDSIIKTQEKGLIHPTMGTGSRQDSMVLTYDLQGGLQTLIYWVQSDKVYYEDRFTVVAHNGVQSAKRCYEDRLTTSRHLEWLTWTNKGANRESQERG